MTMRIALATVLAALLTAAAVHSAYSFSGLGSEFGRMGTRNKAQKAVPAQTGKILLVDGASFILQVDGTSKICRAGGC